MSASPSFLSSAFVVEVRVLWHDTLLHMQRLQRGQTFTIGRSQDADFHVDDAALPDDAVQLVRAADAFTQLYVLQGTKAHHNDGALASGHHTLDDNTVVTMRIGSLDIIVERRQREATLVTKLFDTVDFFYGKVAACVLLLQSAFLVALSLAPRIVVEDDDLQLRQALDIVIHTERDKVKPPPPKKRARAAAPAAGERGLFAPRIAAAPNVVHQRVQRRNNEELVAGVLVALGLNEVNAPVALGLDDAMVAGLNRVHAVGPASGAGGMASRGVSSGGGGNGIDVGALDGDGRFGRGSCDSADCDSGILFHKRKLDVTVDKRNVITKGGLSREEIQRVVKRHLSKVRHCYEKELQKNPNLSGKVVIGWSIGASGHVASANIKQNGLSDVAASCIQRTVKRMRFPRPKGGGQVFVNYPFVFDAH